MAFATRTLRDTAMGTAGAQGGHVTILVNIDDDTTATNAILDASALETKRKELANTLIKNQRLEADVNETD